MCGGGDLSSIATLEWVVRELRWLADDLAACEAECARYRSSIDEAISAPVTPSLTDEAEGWISKVASARSALDYWIADIAWEIYLLEQAEAS